MASRCRSKEIVENLILVVVLLIILPLFAPAQTISQTLKIGDAAPAIKLEGLLQAPAGTTADWDSFKGKVVVMEFWATWCMPCVPGIRHLNKLSEQFKDKPVQFIAVTDEEQPRVAEFLKELPIRGWVGFDTDSSVFKTYKVGGRPHTVVVDQDGKIAAITYPDNVSTAVLNDLLAGKKVSLPFKPLAADAEESETKAEGQAKPLFKMMIEPSATGGWLRRLPGLIEGEIMTSVAIATAYKTSVYRIVSDLPLSKGSYKISALVPKGQEERLYPAFQQALETALGLKVRRELREMDVMVLTKSKGKTTSLRPSQESEAVDVSWSKGMVKAKKQPIHKLANLLEEAFLYQPVVEETGLKQEYDWELPYNRASNSVLLNAIRDNLGLELIKAKRKIEVLVVENAESMH